MDIHYTAIHPPAVIREYAIAEQAIEQSVGSEGVIAGFNGEENQQAGRDARDTAVRDADLRLCDALQQGNHARLVANASAALTNAAVIPGSVAEWPASAITCSSAPGQTACNANAWSTGQTMS